MSSSPRLRNVHFLSAAADLTHYRATRNPLPRKNERAHLVPLDALREPQTRGRKTSLDPSRFSPRGTIRPVGLIRSRPQNVTSIISVHPESRTKAAGAGRFYNRPASLALGAFYGLDTPPCRFRVWRDQSDHTITSRLARRQPPDGAGIAKVQRPRRGAKQRRHFLE